MKTQYKFSVWFPNGERQACESSVRYTHAVIVLDTRNSPQGEWAVLSKHKSEKAAEDFWNQPRWREVYPTHRVVECSYPIGYFCAGFGPVFSPITA